MIKQQGSVQNVPAGRRPTQADATLPLYISFIIAVIVAKFRLSRYSIRTEKSNPKKNVPNGSDWCSATSCSQENIFLSNGRKVQLINFATNCSLHAARCNIQTLYTLICFVLDMCPSV